MRAKPDMQFHSASPADSLVDEIKASHLLLELLKREQAQLIEANIDGLTMVAEEKAQMVAQLASLAKTRHQALASAGFAAEEAGMQKWLESPCATVAANTSWIELLTLARSAKEFNRTNGLLISKHLVRTQNALNVLRGNVQGGGFYGPDGQATARTGTRNLVVG